MKSLFGFDYKKTTQTLNYFARKESSNTIDKLKVIKLIWLADRYHLRKYGRPIIGDDYWAMVKGPVGEAVKDFADKSIFLGDKEKEYSDQYIEKVNNFTIKSLSETDNDVFSQTDLEALKFVFDNFGSYQNTQLVELSHEYPEWKKFKNDLEAGTTTRERMNYLDFFENPSNLPDDKFQKENEALEQSKEIFIEKNKQAELWQ